jgi:ubiquitin-protein ligase
MSSPLSAQSLISIILSPQLPPKMKFISEIWHPNVHENGDVCISILHAPGEDSFGYEDARYFSLLSLPSLKKFLSDSDNTVI